MLHSRYHRRLLLLLHGELSPVQESRLLRHMASCDACRAEHAELEALRSLMSTGAAQRLDEVALEEARARLRGALGSQRRLQRPSMLDGVLEWFVPRRPAAALGGALLLLLAGVLVGRFVFPPQGSPGIPALPRGGGDTAASEPADVSVSNLQIIGGTDGSDEIELVFDVTRSLRIRGTLQNPLVQRVLARAIVHGENPGIRMRAASSAHTGAARSDDGEIKAALLLAMKTDRNDGVRKAALEALLRYPTDLEIRDGFVQVLLADENPGLRVAAIKALGTMASLNLASDARLRQRLQDHVQGEENLFVRTKTESLLKRRIQ